MDLKQIPWQDLKLKPLRPKPPHPTYCTEKAAVKFYFTVFTLLFTMKTLGRK